MDFRGANFSGSAPDPRTFMGGVRYDWWMAFTLITIDAHVIIEENCIED
jgi:hypothetical protein